MQFLNSLTLFVSSLVVFVEAFPPLAAEDNHASKMMHILKSDLDVSPKITQLDKRTAGGIYICTDMNWSGTCGYAVQPFDVCIVLTAPYAYTITSFGPDQYTAALVFPNSDCSSPTTSGVVFNPGTNNLGNQGWNDRIGSFKVYGLPGVSCVGYNDRWYSPRETCRRCCNGCTRSGYGCCPDGQHC